MFEMSLQFFPRTRQSQTHFATFFTRSHALAILLLALLTVSIGCSVLGNTSASSNRNGGSEQQPGQSIRVGLSPTSIVLQPGAKQNFSASVFNTADTRVSWTADAGTISPQGIFIAPTVATTATVTVASLADPRKTASATITVTPASPTLEITTTAIPSATSGSAYSTEVSAVGGRTPYQWTLGSNTLPAGLTLTTSGEISGKTTQTGIFALSVKVTDSAGHSASQNFSLEVSSRQDPTHDGPAELPRVYMQTALADTPSPGSIIKVHAGADLQSALNSATCGDTLELAAAATFTGNFTLPAKPCDDAHWITVRTSAPDASLPPEGTRITPCYAGVRTLHRMLLNCNSTAKVMTRIVGFPPIQAASGSNHYRLVGLELTQIPGHFAYSILDISDSSDHFVADRCWIHGTSADDSQQGVRFNSSYLALVDSFVSDIHSAQSDSQAVGGASGTGPYKIVNNYLEAAGENIMFGGAAATTVPSDIEIRANHLYKPLSWMPGHPSFSGPKWTVKDLFELKNGQRILLEGNIFENMWGTPIVITPKNQNNRCPSCIASDITFRFNIVRHGATALTIADAPSDAGGIARSSQFISIHDDLFDDIDRVKWNPGASSWMFYFGACPQCAPVHDVTMDHLTVVSTNSSFVFMGNHNAKPVTNFAFTENILQNGLYGVDGCGAPSLTTLETCANGAHFSGNVIVAGKPANFPGSNAFPSDWSAVEFRNFANGDGGDYQLLPNSPYNKANSPGADITTLNAKTSGVSQW
jgi:Putative Ig domain